MNSYCFNVQEEIDITPNGSSCTHVSCISLDLVGK